MWNPRWLLYRPVRGFFRIKKPSEYLAVRGLQGGADAGDPGLARLFPRWVSEHKGYRIGYSKRPAGRGVHSRDSGTPVFRRSSGRKGRFLLDYDAAGQTGHLVRGKAGWRGNRTGDSNRATAVLPVLCWTGEPAEPVRVFLQAERFLLVPGHVHCRARTYSGPIACSRSVRPARSGCTPLRGAFRLLVGQRRIS